MVDQVAQTAEETVDEQRQQTVVRDWQAGLETLHSRIAHRFRRAEVRGRARRYLAGLLGPVERKNGWQLAEHLGETGPQGVQRLLNKADWDADLVRDDLRAYVVEQLGEPEGVLVIDETGFLKKGRKSVGVKRQYSGTAGRIENCQIGVFLAYASAKGKAFLDRELYLPREWAEDKARREEAGVPVEVEFATKPALARRMLERAFVAGVPAAWVTGDEVYGKDPGLRRFLEEGNHAYVLEVSCAHPIWQADHQKRVDQVFAALVEDAWITLSAGDGSQGPRLYDWAWVRLPDHDGSHGDQPGGSSLDKARWLLARRSLSDPTEIAYFLAFGPIDTSLSTLARIAGTRWIIEEGFEQAKGTVGLDQYEVRKWNAWYRHVTLALLAHAFLEATRHHASDANNDEAMLGHGEASGETLPGETSKGGEPPN